MANDDFGFGALDQQDPSEKGDEFGFESLSHPDLKNVAEPSRSIESPYRGNFSPIGALATLGGGLIGTPIAGFRGLYDLATGKGGEQAAKDVESTQQAFMPEINQATADVLGSKYNPLNWPGMVAKKGGEITQDVTGSPLAATAVETGLNAATMGIGAGMLRKGATTAVADVSKAVRSTDMALEGTGKNFTNLTPELQTKIINESVNGAIRPEVVRAQADADGITTLTEGQATGNKDVYAMEQELAKRSSKENPPPGAKTLADHFTQQNNDLVNYLDNKIGAGSAMSPAEAGQSALLRMAQIDKAAKDSISEAYNQVRDSNGRSAKLNPEDFYMKAQTMLERDNADRFVPKEIAGLYDDYTNGKLPLTVDSMMAFDKILSRSARTVQDGSQQHAINLIRQALNDTEISGDAGPQAAALYKEARSRARARFELSDPNSQHYVPGYAAMLKGIGKDSHEQFISALENGTSNADPSGWFKSNVANSTPGNAKKLTTLLNNFGATDQVSALQQGLLSSIRNDVVKGNTDIANRGNLSADLLSKALKNKGQTYSQVLSPQTMDDLGKLSRTATRVARAPYKAPINYSGTAATLDNMGQVAGAYGKGIARYGAHAIGGPVAGAALEGATSLADIASKGRQAKKAIAEAEKSVNPPMAAQASKSRGQKLSDFLKKSGSKVLTVSPALEQNTQGP